MPEVKGSYPLTLDEEQLCDLGVEDMAKVVHAKESQESCIRRFLGMEPGSVCVPEKLYRVATWRWLQALDHALFNVTGAGLEQFATRGTKLPACPRAESPVQHVIRGRKTLLIAGDQMSTGPTGVTFCQKTGMELAVELFMDPPHRFWNSEKLGLLQGGAYETFSRASPTT